MKIPKKLFTPIKIGTMEVKNRIVMAPMGTNIAASDGSVTERLINYLAARAKGGVGLIITEITTVDPVAKYMPNTLGAFDDKLIPSWRDLANAVHAYGAKLAPQLIHPGPIATSALTGVQPVGPSAIASPLIREVPREASIEEIEEIVREFGEAARRMKKAGCDGVELHMAHGGHCLVAAFTSPIFNKRADAYGGSLEGRLKFPLEIISSMRAEVGRDFPIIVRISGDELVTDGRSMEETQYMVRILVDAGVDAFHVSAGAYPFIAERVFPPMGTPLGLNAAQAAAIKEVVDVPVMSVGRINNPLIAEHILETGKADLVVIGRALIADPELPKKAATGRLEDIAPCVGCLGCLEGLREGPTCVINPAAGREKEMALTLAEKPKRVLVAGGGPGGLEAARVSALRGHQVTLFEKSDKLGGQLNIACIAPTKQELTLFTKYLSIQVEKAGVKVELGREVTPAVVEELKPDVVIVATGGAPLVPGIPGVGKEKVVTAQDVLLGKVVRRANVVVLGGGMVGCEVADFLAAVGDYIPVGRTAVTIVEMLENIGLDMQAMARALLMQRLRAKDVKVITSAKVKEILDDGVLITGDGQEEAILGMDTIILAMGTRSVDELSGNIKGKVAEVYVIGDAKEPRKALNAIAEGAEIARKI